MPYLKNGRDWSDEEQFDMSLSKVHTSFLRIVFYHAPTTTPALGRHETRSKRCIRIYDTMESVQAWCMSRSHGKLSRDIISRQIVSNKCNKSFGIVSSKLAVLRVSRRSWTEQSGTSAVRNQQRGFMGSRRWRQVGIGCKSN